VTTILRGSWRHLDGAAQVWAEATAARDGDPEVAPLEVSRPVIAAVLGRPGALLVVAVGERGQVAGFAVAAPLAAQEQRVQAKSAEVHYLGVRPGLWGAGLARRLLRFLCAQLAEGGYRDAQLLVYSGNTRAVRLYEQLGWRPQGLPAPHPRTGKPEQRYRLRLAG
jgi:ribosomal protein S18 acetylase RimI-like enzyme